MIEQTELVVNQWVYTPPENLPDAGEKVISELSFDIMKRRNSIKKGIACRFTCKFSAGDRTILLYQAEDSYVIDLNDVVDGNEILTMIRNSYSKFNEKFEMRKLNTILHDRAILPLDESKIDLEQLLLLLY